jgi:hypothetical protein
MKCLSMVAVAFTLFCFGLPKIARADAFTFTVTGSGISGSGTLYATPSATVANAEEIDSVSGSINGSQIVTLLPGSYDPNNLTTLYFPDNEHYFYDNLVYTMGVPFDFGGVLFQLANGEYYNLYDDKVLGLAYLTFEGNCAYDDAYGINTAATVAISQVPAPEPSSLLLLSTGLFGAAFFFRHRQKVAR